MSNVVYTVTMFEDEEWNEWAGIEVYGNIESAARRAWAHEQDQFAIIGEQFEGDEGEYVSIANDTHGYLGGHFFAMRPEIVRG